MVEKIEDVLVRRDGMTLSEAKRLVAEAKIDFMERIARGEMPYDICEEWFGLEPDYAEQFIY